MTRDLPASPTRTSPMATEQLRSLMIAAGIASFRALARQAQVSDWTIRQLRSDRLPAMRLETLQKIAAALNLSLAELLSHFGAIADSRSADNEAAPAAALATLQTEYQRLQTQLEQQAVQLQAQFQTTALTTLESWLLQWPTVTHAVENNPDLPASRLVPLVNPVQTLLEQWAVEAIAPVGAIVPFDPQLHQLMNGHANPGELVKIRYTGFRHQGKLLHRAQVSPIQT
ncbi:helix-turn-helix domain-containing protein [Halomicronema sp. CCY15110]|uniref:helix-turn-helix domain-containing protein n=1 Tax=Halomicronema sp. CCY15110 TaxID=2767773 RepID=UPI0019522DE3|nr:helix-turn-helix domain-containing protein [Halomicronema sp. CCY15110]